MTAHTKFARLPSNRYSVILADPPWAYNCWDGDRHARSAAENHYSTMSTRQICNMDVIRIADPKHSVLLLWATWPKLPDALEVIREWGFTYKTCAFLWAKSAGKFVGMGYYTRANSEPCLLATLGGNPEVHDRAIRQVITSAPRGHSQKPRALYERVDRLFGKVPRVELFCRGTPASGWDGWGDECDGGATTMDGGPDGS